MSAASLIDTFGRLHDSLRISVTDRCNIRCFYCMPEDVKFGPREEILSFEEIVRFVRIAAGLGVRKLRLTGGEPLLRKGLPDLVAQLHAVPGIDDIAMTTNGVTLKQHARDLYDAGLRRLNVHLDTLDRERFLKITRRDDLAKVLDGLAFAKELGFGPIKINVVAVTNLIEPDAVRKAVADSVPASFRDLNLKAFEKGFDYGLKLETLHLETDTQTVFQAWQGPM